MAKRYSVICGCCLEKMAALEPGSVDLTVTSPPYFQLKDYGDDRQIGWESSRDEYLGKMTRFMLLLRGLTAPSGSAFIVIGDSYDRGTMQLIPQRLACIAADMGWHIRNDLIWSKTDAAPGKTPNRWRFTHEHILFLTKSPNAYVFDDAAIRQPYSVATLRRWGKGQRYGGPKAKKRPAEWGKKQQAKGNRLAAGKSFVLNPGGTLPSDVIQLPSGRSKFKHYATFPLALAETFVVAASGPDALVFDPFTGSGTTGEAALRRGRRFLGIELSAEYAAIARGRLSEVVSESVPATAR
jgi:DNA modification methylase